MKQEEEMSAAMALFGDDGAAGLKAGEQALERLKQREEILQICYWYQGEGLGSTFMPQSVMPFLQADPYHVAETFDELAEAGDFQRGELGYVFTAEGRRKAARMFVETFTDFQQSGHGECQDGCCDGNEPCTLNPTTGVCVTPHHQLRYVPAAASESKA
jgi:hypothetical protein